MITHHTRRNLIWLDMRSPTEDEISGLIKRYDLHPLVGEELKSPSRVAKIDFYDNYIMVVLTMPVRVRNGDLYEIVEREIDFIIGKNFLVTTRYDTIEQLEYFAKIFEANSILNKDESIEHAGHLFYYMVKRIYAGMYDDLENIKDSLLRAESRIFNGDERKMVEVLSNLSRELIDFKQTARIHHDIWEEMIANAGKTLFGSDFSTYIHDIRDEFNRIHELIVNARELLADLRETNDSLLNTKQNDIIKILTIISFVFYPLSLIVALFSIPLAHLPLIGNPYDWTIIVIIMGMVASAMLWYFKAKKWF